MMNQKDSKCLQNLLISSDFMISTFENAKRMRRYDFYGAPAYFQTELMKRVYADDKPLIKYESNYYFDKYVKSVSDFDLNELCSYFYKGDDLDRPFSDKNGPYYVLTMNFDWLPDHVVAIVYAVLMNADQADYSFIIDHPRSVDNNVIRFAPYEEVYGKNRMKHLREMYESARQNLFRKDGETDAAFAKRALQHYNADNLADVIRIFVLFNQSMLEQKEFVDGIIGELSPLVAQTIAAYGVDKITDEQCMRLSHHTDLLTRFLLAINSDTPEHVVDHLLSCYLDKYTSNGFLPDDDWRILQSLTGRTKNDTLFKKVCELFNNTYDKDNVLLGRMIVRNEHFVDEVLFTDLVKCDDLETLFYLFLNENIADVWKYLWFDRFEDALKMDPLFYEQLYQALVKNK